MRKCPLIFVVVATAGWLLTTVTTVQSATIDWVPIGSPGNSNDTHGAGYGGVDYEYKIGKTEVTNLQYVDFLNAKDPTGSNALGLYSSFMALHPSGGIELNNANGDGNKYGLIAGRENLPVIFVSWYDSIRFANWLHNDQGSGDTETGAYTLGALDQFGVPLNGLAIERNAGAKVFLTSENEWYKAAYYDAPAAAYVDYPTGTNNEPNSDQPPGDPAIAANAANFFRDTADVGYNDGFAVTGSPLSDFNQGYLTEVGAYVDSPSLLGTYDQGGNVWEWNESLIDGFFRGFRGGSWDYQSAAMQAAFRNEIDPTFEGFSVGFRVAMVPEPSSGMLAWLAIVGVMRWRRVAARH